MGQNRLRVLLAEKRLSEARIILREICAKARRELELVFVASREELGEALRAHCPDVVLLDLTLLQPEAVAYLIVLHLAYKSVPILLFAETADKAIAEECVSMGARDYLLEGSMDGRTVMGALRSALGEMEGRAEMEAPAGEEDGCGHCPDLERMEEIRSRRGKEEVDTMLEGVVRALEKNVRAMDQILLRPCGQIDLVLASADERKFGNVVQRLRGRLKEFWGPHLLDLSSVVTIREGRRVMACEAVMRDRTGGGAVNEICRENALVER